MDPVDLVAVIFLLAFVGVALNFKRAKNELGPIDHNTPDPRTF